MSMGELGHLGRLIQDWRDSLPVHASNAEIARKVGVSKSWIGKWLRGESGPNPSALKELARVTGIPERALLDAMYRDAGYDVGGTPPGSDKIEAV